MDNNIITVNVNKNFVEIEDDVRFTLPLPKTLDKKVKEKAKKFGLTKTAYIRMVLMQDVEMV